MVVVAGGKEDVLPAGVWLGPCDVWPVVYEKVSRDNSLVLGQHNLLQKIGAKVLLHPSILLIRTVLELLDGACTDEDISVLQIGHLLHSFHSSWKRLKFKEEIL